MLPISNTHEQTAADRKEENENETGASEEEETAAATITQTRPGSVIRSMGLVAPPPTAATQAPKTAGEENKRNTHTFETGHRTEIVTGRTKEGNWRLYFGCVRIIPYVRDGLKLYKDRFLSSLPAARRASADFTRPVFMAVAFYLCAKKHKLKVDKIKLIELCGTSESEFSSVSTTMKDLCHDVFGVAKEKKDPKEVKNNIDLLDDQAKEKLRTVAICSMMEQRFQVIKKGNRQKHVIMRSGNLQSFLHPINKIRKKCLARNQYRLASTLLRKLLRSRSWRQYHLCHIRMRALLSMEETIMRLYLLLLLIAALNQLIMLVVQLL
ncbi:Origin of replication complex subunit 6 [Trifolium repens]|nr:Origin of replication complex subunit 6 [Trifolium repens]